MVTNPIASVLCRQQTLPILGYASTLKTIETHVLHQSSFSPHAELEDRTKKMQPLDYGKREKSCHTTLKELVDFPGYTLNPSCSQHIRVTKLRNPYNFINTARLASWKIRLEVVHLVVSRRLID